MAKKFKLNGKNYDALEFDFNLVCDLADIGIDMDDINTKPSNFLRAYIAICIGKDVADAGKEISNHVIKGGKMDDIANVMRDKMENSDFFRHLLDEQEVLETENPESN